MESSPDRGRGPRTPPGEGPHEELYPRFVPYPYKTPDLPYPSIFLGGKVIYPKSQASQVETPEDGLPSSAREPENEDPPCQPSQEETKIIRRVAKELRSPVKKGNRSAPSIYNPAGISKKRPREPEDPTSNPSTSQEGTSRPSTSQEGTEDPTSNPCTSQEGTSKIMTRSRTGKNKDKKKGITHNRREKAKKTEDGQYAALDDSCSPLASSEEDK